MKIVIFGIGRFYQEHKEEIISSHDIERVAFIDNNPRLHGTFADGLPVFAVERVESLDFDVIILMSIKADEMRAQLIGMGIAAEKIWYWEKFRSKFFLRGVFRFSCGSQPRLSGQKKILIITVDFGYHGGIMAAVYAAAALQERGYYVALAASGGDPAWIEEMKQGKHGGFDILLFAALPYLYQEELAIIGQFDICLCQCFPMILCASEISRIKSVIWWIHESSAEYYEPVINRFSEYAAEKQLEKVSIYAVSRIAQKKFNCYFPDRIRQVMAYGIPDERQNTTGNRKESRLVFAVVGGLMSRKGQDIFLEAVKKLEFHRNADIKFRLIGGIGQNAYSDRIRILAEELSVDLPGEMNREEIQRAYADIDVLVCPSREDPLPIVVTEAMMYGKACIVSDAIGNVDYISDGTNGFLFRTEDADDLAKKMAFAIENRDVLQEIGENARQTYETYFTMEQFGERLEEAISDTERNFYAEVGRKRK